MIMAKTTPTKTAKAEADPLASPAGRIWLAGELAKAERAVREGPGGTGWKYNESLRAAVTERAAFLRALSALLN